MKYSIYLAKIEGVTSFTDSRLKVRVLPDMEGISSEKLPMWPCFFRNEVITGGQNSLVWVISNEEFTTGYVLGYANFYSWKGDYSNASIPQDLYDALDNANINLKGKVLNYSDIMVSFWNENTIHFVERATGATIIAFRNGTIHTIKPDAVEMKVGNSLIKISETEIVISADTVRIEGQVRLGKNPQGKAFVSVGTSGRNAIPSKDVWC